jgi:hypothetical protein
MKAEGGAVVEKLESGHAVTVRKARLPVTYTWGMTVKLLGDLAVIRVH